MSDLFQPISAEQLISWVFSELDSRGSIFGIPRSQFFVPGKNRSLQTKIFGQGLDTPFGPAAGPHTQMAQNIVAAWLCGARYVELKTVQTLDVLDVSKPCIDMRDEGYNVEWSQELKIEQSFEEYLRAWVLIHALHHKLGFPGESPDMVFNLSVGYDLAGIQQPNMQWFLNQVTACPEHKQTMIDRVARYYPAVRDLDIPDRLSDNVTLSTMHGCPPDEIESISQYLLRERGLHTLVKCNPTLLGPEGVRELLNEKLGYSDVVVPDIAFEHDLKYRDAVAMIGSLRGVAKDCGLTFGVKLSNTLEVENDRSVFGGPDEMMYLSGRALHAVTVNLAHRLAEEFDGELLMSFSAGANCFNAPDLLACGMATVTVCSDLLKTGGYLRLAQYLENAEQALQARAAKSLGEFILKSARHASSPREAALHNLAEYAARTGADPKNIKGTFDTAGTKTGRPLDLFDCIQAPCMDECPLDQKVPQYMRAVRAGDLDEAARLVREDNPIPCVLGRVCDHLCEHACVRSHLDEPVAIRDVKRFIMDRQQAESVSPPADPMAGKVAIIGAGPGGMAAARELATAGCQVDIFEQQPYPGGMVGGAVPEYRLPQAVFDRDFAPLEQLGVKVHYHQRAGRDFTLPDLQRDGFDAVAIMVGAQLSKTLKLKGEDCQGVVDALEFLRGSREERVPELGERVGVIGAGDTAMDCARTAWRRSDAKVTLIYRRTVDQMPADREEITHLMEEGIEVVELCKPQRLQVEDGRLRGLVCRRMEFSGERDASGRKIPVEIPDSEVEFPLDTLILAISQTAVLDFFGGQPVALNDKGYIAADPETFATSVAGVYAGGDVANEGPASIVKAAAAGKAIAASILSSLGHAEQPALAHSPPPVQVNDLLARRGHRQWRTSPPETPLDRRRNFDEVVRTYAVDQARAEAERCLDCDRYCSLCVSVCPNLALQTYQAQAMDLVLPDLARNGGALQATPGTKRFRVQQSFQVAVLADFCNECGNCTTFCPTAGRPFNDKPRLYLDREEFESQDTNAFMLFSGPAGWAMDARWQGTTHRLELNGRLDYSAPGFDVTLDPDSFSVESAALTSDDVADSDLSLEPCAAMLALLRGLQQSLPFLPVQSDTPEARP